MGVMDYEETSGNIGTNLSSTLDESVIVEYTTAKLWQQAWAKAGKALFYMEFLHPEIYSVTDPQLTRVKQMCYHLAAEWRSHIKDNPENRKWFQDWLEEFDDETENMC